MFAFLTYIVNKLCELVMLRLCTKTLTHAYVVLSLEQMQRLIPLTLTPLF